MQEEVRVNEKEMASEQPKSMELVGKKRNEVVGKDPGLTQQSL